MEGIGIVKGDTKLLKLHELSIWTWYLGIELKELEEALGNLKGSYFIFFFFPFLGIHIIHSSGYIHRYM